MPQLCHFGATLGKQLAFIPWENESELQNPKPWRWNLTRWRQSSWGFVRSWIIFRTPKNTHRMIQQDFLFGFSQSFHETTQHDSEKDEERREMMDWKSSRWYKFVLFNNLTPCSIQQSEAGERDEERLISCSARGENPTSPFIIVKGWSRSIFSFVFSCVEIPPTFRVENDMKSTRCLALKSLSFINWDSQWQESRDLIKQRSKWNAKSKNC